MEPAELGRRRPVWEAMSEVFLDTETRWYLPRIASVLLASGYDLPALDRIWRREIYPECAYNLAQVAGEWAALPLDEAALIARAEAGPSWFTRWFRRVPGWLDGQWRAILALHARLAAEDGQARASLVSAWSAFAHVYVEPSLDRVLFIDGDLGRLHDSGLSRQACRATFDADFRPVYRSLLIGAERAQEEARAGNVIAVIERALT